MEILIGILSAAIGGGGVWLLSHARHAALRERLRIREDQLADATRELASERERNERSAEAILTLERALAAEQATAQARVAELCASHERIRAEFAEIAGAALRTNRDDFLQLAHQSLGQLTESAQKDMAARELAVANLVAPLRESLAKVDQHVDQLEKTRASAYGALGQQLETLHTAQLRLQAEAARLASALSTTRTAGTWGEVQLRRVVELAGLVEHCDFSEQCTPGRGERDRADLLVHLPAGQQIVVDAKAPTEAFREAAVESDPQKRATKLAEHAAKVRMHCDALGSREYWDKFQPSPEFVVLFLPGDAFLSTALEADPALLDRALAKKVLLATPSTLIALLKAAAYGWRQDALSKNAEEISRIGRQLHDRIALFADHLDKVGRALESATRGYNQAVGCFEGSLMPGARKFAELGAQGGKQLASPIQAEAAPRQILKS